MCSTSLLPTLNLEQQEVYEKVIMAVAQGEEKLFCRNASGGTGETHTINVILDYLRSQNKIALATAVSGIAANLMNNGQSLHSRGKIPLHIQDNSICGFSKLCATGHLIQQAQLLVMDEVTMGHYYILP